MNDNPMGSDYLYQKAVLRELAKPGSEGANVNLEQPATAYAAGKAASEADAVRFASDINLKQAALKQSGEQFQQKTAEGDRQFLSRILSARDELDTWAKQNDLATLIAGASIPVQGLAMSKNMDRLDKQDAVQQEITQANKGMISLQDVANKTRLDELQTYLSNLPIQENKEAVASVLDLTKPSKVPRAINY